MVHKLEQHSTSIIFSRHINQVNEYYCFILTEFFSQYFVCSVPADSILQHKLTLHFMLKTNEEKSLVH